MNARDLVVVFAAWFLLTVIQLVAALVSAPLGFVAGLALGGLVFGILYFFALDAAPGWLGMVLAPTASVAAVLICVLADIAKNSLWLWLAPAGALLVSGVITALQSRDVRRCSLCERKIPGGETLFACPRCGLEICDLADCWIHGELRCRVCYGNQVRIFPPEKDRWWEDQVGARVRRGVCQVTHEPAADVDLRACRNCGRLQSTLAWDLRNGECASCRWTIPDLPRRLRAFMPDEAPRRSRERERRARS